MDETTQDAVVADRPGPDSDTSKLLAAAGYIIPLVAIIAILIDPYKNEKFVKFHAVQALALWVAATVVNIIPILGQIASVALFVVAIIAAIKAYQEEYWEMPVLFGLIKGMVGE